MKIAVCFSGQIRTGVEASINIKNYLGELYKYCDFFIHTWDINSHKNYNFSAINKRETFISDDVIDNIKILYKPIKIVVDKYYQNDVKPNIFIWESGQMNGGVLAHWFSFMKSVKYKKEYEKNNNFIYDYVIKLRPDVIFPPDRKLQQSIDQLSNNTIYIENFSQENITDNIVFIDDVHYVGKSKSMDFLANYFNYLNYKNLDGNLYGDILINYLSKNNLKVTKKSYSGYLIYREECLEYSSLLEFDKCIDCFNYYYGNGDKNYVNDLKKIYIEDDTWYKSNVFIYIDELKIKK